MVPSLEELAPAPLTKTHLTAQKKCITVLEDVEMDDVATSDPELGQSLKKGKGRLQLEGNQSVGVLRDHSKQSNVGGPGSKRVLQESLSRAEVPVKRLRVAGKLTGDEVVIANIIDLGIYTFDEDSVIDPPSSLG